MEISKVYASEYNINYKGIKQFAKAAGVMASGIAATLAGTTSNKVENTTDDDDLYDDLSNVEDTDSNIFDEEFYQAYYNIDLNLAKNRAFRDNELFNPLRDKENYEYRMYDEFDIKHADNLIFKNDINEYTTKYKLADTDFGDLHMPDIITKPDKAMKDDLNVQERYIKLNERIKELKVSKFVKDVIMETCKRDTEGFFEVDFDLVNIALDLYENDRNGWYAKGDLLDIINIIKEYDIDSDEYKYLCNFISAGILAHQPNSKIYEKIHRKSIQYTLQ